MRTGAVTVVVNRKASGTQHALAALRAALDAHHLDVRAFHVASSHEEVHRHVSRAAKHGADTVIVGGGDGTMAHAVDALAHRDTVLGVVPLGTGNSFAQSLGIPRHDVPAAVEIVARGNVRQIDVGRVNGTHFANFATIGLSSAIAGATSTEGKHVFGPLAYALAALRPLLSHRSFRAKITWKGGSLNVRTQDVIIANGRYFGSTPVTPDASLEDRRLKLFTTSDPSRLGALVTYVAIGLHAQNHLPDAHVLSARRFTIRADPRQMISIDGSLFEKTPARFRVEPNALNIFVP